MAYYILKSYKFSDNSLSLFNALKVERYPFFLESSINSRPLGRYSFLGCNPFHILDTKDKEPFSELKMMLDKYKIAALNKISPFLGGAVGYLSYDLGFMMERKLVRKINDELPLPDCFFGFYDTVLIHDHFRKRLFLFSSGLPETKYNLAKRRAESRFKETLALLRRVQRQPRRGFNRKKRSPGTAVKSNFSKQQYIEVVKKAKEYIKKGDIYQVNLAQRFTAQAPLAADALYGRLRNLSPSFFSGYLDCGDFQIISSSPERFLNLNGRLITTRPMKGTRPRSRDKAKDHGLKKELVESAKDKAELIMIVDLERNDLGRVCSYGSVKIETLRELETYNTVFQTTATVSGLLHKDKDRIDLLKACFPGGSVTGCPKIRAMEIIEELETARRSVYTGSLGYLSFSGDMDMNILIRTIIKKQERIYFHAGGGIVADSQPEAEYEETLVKARAMIEAIS